MKSLGTQLLSCYLLLTFGLDPCLTNPLLETTHPVTFSPMGEIISSGSHYIVPLKLDIHTLLSRIYPLEEALTNTSHHYETLRDLIGDDNGGNDTRHRHFGGEYALQHFPQSLRSHITLLIADLHQRVANLKDMLSSLADFGLPTAPDTLKLRRTRGAIDAVGSGLHWLFGLTDSATFNEAKIIIDQLQDLSEKERQQLNLHNKVLNATALHIDRLEANQQKAQNAIINLDSNMIMLSTALRKSNEAIFEISNVLNMVSSISYAASAVMDLTYEFGRVSTGLTTMVRGKLAAEILPSKNLAKIINELNLQNTRTLWPSSARYLPLFYKFAQVICINYKEFIFLVLLPLLPEDNAQLSLYRVSSLPYPLNKNLTLGYGQLAPYFAITQDHQLYSTLTDNDLSSCHRFSSLYYCDHPKPLMKSTAPSCEYAFFTQRDIDVSCEKHISPKLPRPLFIRTPTNWLYATSRPFALTVVCPSGTRTITVEIGVGAINLPQKCRASSDFALLPITMTLERSTLEVINFTAVVPFKLDLNANELALVDQFSNDTLYQDILHLNGKDIPLSSLKNEIGQLRIIQRTRMQAYQYSMSATWLSLVLFIIIIFSCTGFFIGYRILAGHRLRLFGKVFNEEANAPTHDEQEMTAPLTDTVHVQ